MPFKVTTHMLVPKHVLLDEKETQEILAKYAVDLALLPKITTEDPVIRELAAGIDVKPEALKGRVVKIIRRSETAGEAPAYRVIIEG